MKKILLTAILFIGSTITGVLAQDSKYSTLYCQRASLFEELPITKSDIVFLGNSITHYAEWSEIFNDEKIKNRGISGDIIQGVYDRLDPILKGKPKKIFLLIGINDVSHNVTADSIVRGISKIASRILKESPRTKLYIQSVFPVNDSFGKFIGTTTQGGVIIEINKGLKNLCLEKSLTYIDVYSCLKSADSEKLNPDYTNDGLHLLGKGYMVWKKVLERYIY
jgi:lysophospholipase L1-like esterase